MFGSPNTIEPVQPERRRVRAEDPPVREATTAEFASLRPKQTVPSVRALPDATLPDPIAQRHGLYTADRRRTRTYYADYQQRSEVMRADPRRITTKLDDRQTVSAVLDLAQSRQWDRVRLRGTEGFKREAWVQAQVRGMKTEGYQPTATDRQEADKRRAAMAPAVEARAAPSDDVGKQAAYAAQRRAQSERYQAGNKAAWGAVEEQGQQARAKDAQVPKASVKEAA